MSCPAEETRETASNLKGREAWGGWGGWEGQRPHWGRCERQRQGEARCICGFPLSCFLEEVKWEVIWGDPEAGAVGSQEEHGTVPLSWSRYFPRTSSRRRGFPGVVLE